MALSGIIPGIEQGYQYGEYGQGSKIGRLGGITVGAPRAVEGGEYGGIAGINGELTPNYAAQDTTYTNGLGHSKHKFMMMG